MEDLYIRKSHHTPGVFFTTKGELCIQGISITSNSFVYYSSILKWLKDFTARLPKKVKLDLEFEYLDTSSKVCIIDVVRTVAGYRDAGTEVEINWICQPGDEDNRLRGEDLEYCVGIGFKFIEKQKSTIQ